MESCFSARRVQFSSLYPRAFSSASVSLGIVWLGFNYSARECLAGGPLGQPAGVGAEPRTMWELDLSVLHCGVQRRGSGPQASWMLGHLGPYLHRQEVGVFFPSEISIATEGAMIT